MTNAPEVRLGLGNMGGDWTRNYISVDGQHLASWLRSHNEHNTHAMQMYTMTGIDAPNEQDARKVAEQIKGHYCGTFLATN